MKLDLSFDASPSTIYFDNATIIPPGSTFALRLVVLKGVKTGRIKQGISYEELQELYGLQ